MPDDRDRFDPERGASDRYRALPPELNPRGPSGTGPGAPVVGARAARRGQSGRRDVAAGLDLGGRVVAALISLAVLVTAGVVWARYRQFQGDITRVAAIQPSVAPKKDVDGTDQNILIVGNDDRSTATNAELAALGTTTDGGSLNTDTMMLLHVPANGKKAAAISFPRDSLVDIPGHGQDKLNAAYVDGVNANNGSKAAGAALLVQTIQNLTGLTIDHYVQVDLLGFYRISNAIGGVTVCLNAAQGPATYVGQEGNGFDSGYEPNGTWVASYSGINLHQGVNVGVQGKQALAFVRQRHGLPRGDLDRIVRQQYFLSAVFRKITSAGVLLNPIKLNNLLGAVSSSLQLDGNSPGHTGLDPLKLAQQMQGLAAGNLTFTQIPTSSQTIDGTSYQIIDAAGMKARIAALIGTTVPSAYAAAKVVAPATVTVNVLNGTGGSGVAASNAATLTQAGFKTTIGDGSSASTTQILYPAGQESGAKTLAQYVPGASVSVSTTVTTVTLLLGSDGKKAYPVVTTAAPATAAPTTAAATTPATGSSQDTRTAADASCIN